MPPAPASCWLKVMSTTETGSGEAVVMLGAVVMVRSKAFAAVRPLASVISTVKWLAVAAVGVPLSRPLVLSVSPFGSVPAFTVN